MIKKSLIFTFALLALSVAASANPPKIPVGLPSAQSVTAKSGRLYQKLYADAYKLNALQLFQIDQYLELAFNATQNPNPTYPPTPPTPPTPPYPYDRCNVDGYGQFNGYNYNYRIKLTANNTYVDAADDLDTLLNKLKTLQNGGVCTPKMESCTLLGYGSYRGYNWNFRLKADNDTIFGTDQFDTMKQTLNKLQYAGVCSPQAYGRCEMLGNGPYRGYNWKYRVAIDGLTPGLFSEIVYGTDQLNDAIQKMNELRTANLCN